MPPLGRRSISFDGIWATLSLFLVTYIRRCFWSKFWSKYTKRSKKCHGISERHQRVLWLYIFHRSTTASCTGPSSPCHIIRVVDLLLLRLQHANLQVVLQLNFQQQVRTGFLKHMKVETSQQIQVRVITFFSPVAVLGGKSAYPLVTFTFSDRCTSSSFWVVAWFKNLAARPKCC